MKLTQHIATLNHKNKELLEQAQCTSVLEKGAIISKTDIHGIIRFTNEQFCDISGYTEDELIGQNHRIVNSGVHSELFFKEMWRTISSGNIWSGELCNRKKNGELYWVNSTIVPIYDESGRIYQYTSIRFDITEKKLFAQQLAELQRLESIGRMTAGIAHDFNNILGCIIGHAEFLDVLASDLPKSESALQNDFHVNIAEITNASWRAADLIGKMLTYCQGSSSSSEDKQLPLLNINTELENLLTIFKAVDAGVIIKKHLKSSLTSIYVEKTEFQQTIINLLTNASDAMENKGEIQITTEHVIDFSNHCSACAKKIDGKFLKITVSDTGCGIPNEKIGRIFDPFFTTKEVGKGVGK